MTYCLGMLLKAGLIIMADTRTNAGIDNFSTFKKLHLLSNDDDRKIFVASAGNLSISQSVLTLIEEDQIAEETGDLGRSLPGAPTMFRAAQIIGDAVQKIGETTGAALARAHIDSSVSLLVGGRIGEAPLKLFLIYSEGNFIECTAEVPFLQVGETKYGRPILDRLLRYDTPLHEAVKIGILSFDSTMKSNLGVARPIDIVVVPQERGQPIITRRIEEEDPYYDSVTGQWAELLRKATQEIASPPWM